MDQDEYGFSQETRDWLGGWLSGGEEITNLPEIVVEETKGYVNNENDQQQKLYKAVTSDDILTDSLYKSSKPSSWTYKLEIAKLFKSEYPIIEVFVANSNMLIDTTQLDWNYIKRKLGGTPEEAEVILLPGSYRYEITEK